MNAKVIAQISVRTAASRTPAGTARCALAGAGLGLLLAACATEDPHAQVAEADCAELAEILRETTPGEVGGSGLQGLVEVGQDFGYFVTRPQSLLSENLRGVAWTAYHERGC